MTAYDVVVVGAGAVGAATARALAGLDLRVALVEARSDVGAGTSKANTAILHTGFDATPGSLEATLVRRGYELLGAYAAQTGIPVERTGALLVAWTQEQVDTLPALDAKAKANGYARCELLDAEAVYAAVPDLGPGALAGLTPSSSATSWASPASRRPCTPHANRCRPAGSSTPQGSAPTWSTRPSGISGSP